MNVLSMQQIASSLYTSVLNKTTKIPFETSFEMLIAAIVFPFALGIEDMHENEKPAVYSGSCIQLT